MFRNKVNYYSISDFISISIISNEVFPNDGTMVTVYVSTARQLLDDNVEFMVRRYVGIITYVLLKVDELCNK